MSRPIVAGVGMVKFAKPGTSRSYHEMAAEAVRSALGDAGLAYYDSTCGQRSVYDVGMTGVPIVNVNSNCSSGSTVLWATGQRV